jgi:hypothetical protein
VEDKRPDLAKIAELEDMLLDNPPEYDAEFDATRTIETREGFVVQSLVVRVFLRVDPNAIGNILVYTDQHDPLMWLNDGIPTEVRMVMRTGRGVIMQASDWVVVGTDRTFMFTEARQT